MGSHPIQQCLSTNKASGRSDPTLVVNNNRQYVIYVSKYFKIRTYLWHKGDHSYTSSEPQKGL